VRHKFLIEAVVKGNTKEEMKMKKITMLVAVVMVFILVAGCSAPTDKEQDVKLKGVVVNHDAQAGTITLEADKVGSKGQVMNIDPALIEEIAVGDVVEYEKAGNTVKSIKKIMPPSGESF
jgi:PBP1b-binding outer membrane lipoprotein LpoB